MAYLICRAPRAFSRVSSISSLAATCLRTTRPAVPLISRALSSATVDSQDTPIDESLLPQPIDRSYETPEVTRARLVYQSRKRGILETDLLLSTFASKHLSTMGEAEMREYDQLLDEPDWEIYYWATQKKPAPEKWRDSAVLALLREHVKNEGKVILRMPDLQV